MAVSGKGLAALGAGSLFVWSGIKGWSVMGTLGDLITGVKPSQAPVNALQSGGTAGNSTPVMGTDLGSIAKGYVGHGYIYGGAPGKDASHGWDCSSFVNYVAGIVAGLPIPGYSAGKYDGSTHGPATGQWGIWPGLNHIPRSSVQSGDIIVWLNHMGIATSNSSMVSALNSLVGTKETSIEGNGNGPILCYGRYGTGPGNVKAQ